MAWATVISHVLMGELESRGNAICKSSGAERWRAIPCKICSANCNDIQLWHYGWRGNSPIYKKEVNK